MPLSQGGGESSEVLYVADNGKFNKEFYRENLEPYIQGYVIAYTCPVCGFIGSCIPNKCYLPSLPPNFVCPYRCENIFVCRHNPRRDSINQKSKFISFLTDTTCKVLRSKEKLLKTNWSLWAPFNDLADIVEVVDSVGNVHKLPAFIGCNAVAVLQIMAYHKFPNTLGEYIIPWERFREMDEFIGEDRKLIAYAARYVADQIKSKYGYQKGSRETSAYSSDVKEFMLRVGYKDYTSQQYDVEVVKKEIDQERPVFITASRKGMNVGHIWIIDGYKELLYTKQTDSVVYNFVHCNWGWSKKSNQGYCLSGMFSTERQYNDRDIINFNINQTPPQKAYTEYCRIYIGIEPND